MRHVISDVVIKQIGWDGVMKLPTGDKKFADKIPLSAVGHMLELSYSLFQICCVTGELFVWGL